MASLIKLNKVVGYLYSSPKPSSTAIIWCKGGPSLGDNGKSEIWPLLKRKNITLFIPDYIGFCRSDGKFDFKGCVETITESEEFLEGKLTAIDTLTGEQIKVKINKIILVGSSLGGAIVPFYEKYRSSSIKDIVLIKAVTDWKKQGKTRFKEEDTFQTSKFIERGWKNIYRGFIDSEWPEIFQGKLIEYNPIDNTEFLENKNVYIYHGDKDKVVNWRQSNKLYRKLKEKYPQINVYFKLMKGYDHSSDIGIAALKNILRKVS